MDLAHIKTLEDLKKVKHDFYQGELKTLQDAIKTAAPESRAELGKRITALKIAAETAFAAKQAELDAAEVAGILKRDKFDVTTPLTTSAALHPLTQVAMRLRTWLLQHGYFEASGTEIESDFYNFEQLNIPKNHPARDMQDSLYLNDETLLRTHNTGFTARELEKHVNTPFAQFSIGKVYRNDENDQTHSHQFMQLDLVAVGTNLSIPNLIWTLTEMLSYALEEKVQIRLRPSYFPFTEPSMEVDVFYNNRWIEVLGSGMLHENVFKKAGFTNKKLNGFAAGLGIERLAMIKHGITDIREFYRNDLRFLEQFKKGLE